jgi:hypothetical protein
MKTAYGGSSFSKEEIMKASRWLILIFFVSWSAIARSLSAADLYQGRVVDEETGQSLAGAVVTVIWFRSAIIALEGARDFQSAQETVTDSDGKFSLVVSPGIDWSPFSYIRKEPKIVIYQPAYEPTWAGWMVRNKYMTSTDLAEALKKGATIKLQKLKTKEELGKFTSPDSSGLISVGVPIEAIPKLARAVNTQRKMAGIESYYTVSPEGGKKP